MALHENIVAGFIIDEDTGNANVFARDIVFYGNGTKVNDPSDYFELGGIVDAVEDPYTDQPNDNFTPASSDGVNVPIAMGLINASATNIDYASYGLSPQSGGGGGSSIYMPKVRVHNV